MVDFYYIKEFISSTCVCVNHTNDPILPFQK